MAQLFGNKWLSNEGEPMDCGKPSENFLFWCRKTAHMTDAQWRRGMDHVENSVRESARQGDEVWPPSYAAFLGMCDPRPGSKMYRPFEPLKLPDKTAQERAIAQGEKTISDLKAMFDN